MKKYEKVFDWHYYERENAYLLYILGDCAVAELKHYHDDEWFCVYSIDGKFEGKCSIDEDGIHDDDYLYVDSIYAKDVEDAKKKAVDVAFQKYYHEEVEALIKIECSIHEKIRKLHKYNILSQLDLHVGDKVRFDFWEMYDLFEDDFEDDFEVPRMKYCKVKLEFIKLPDDEPGEPAWDNICLLDRTTNRCVLDTLNDECYIEEIYDDSVLFKNIGFGDERFFKLEYDVIFTTIE